ncbi:hypothetical protein N1031_08620 [Herbiconiux moechotypicola]|uniref:Integral membrane protein n=1 Tax=Herbiconiux moechotypicola TaxID=637393 RepID=A0ABP5QDH6_9MICO|nr:hypothetical protein [Herbiconiux moechotypicola]MCS5729822.1 hypothetical protein [Herbiconiux moechotypicola]
MTPQPLLAAAATSYAANCALGGAVALRVVDTSGFRWVHHALYISTCVLTGTALVALVVAATRTGCAPHRPHDRPRSRDTARASAALALLPTAVPLAIIPRVSARTRRHPLIALAAAPFYAAALLLDGRR